MNGCEHAHASPVAEHCHHLPLLLLLLPLLLQCLLLLLLCSLLCRLK